MSDETPKLRLRPKLTEGPSPAAAPASPPAPAPDAPPVASEPNAAPAATPETKSIRLKPRAPAAPAAVASGAPAPAPPPAVSPVPPPAPVPAAAPITAAGESAVPPPETSEAPAPLAERAKAVQRTALLIAAAGVVVFAGVAAIAFPKLIAQQAEQDAAAQRIEKLIRDANVDTGDPALADKPAAPAAPPPVAPPPAAATPPATAVAPAPALATDTPGEPSDAFRTWVMALKITGLRTGDNPRILVGGATFAVGDTVNAELGIRFDGYDAARGVLRFKDPTGALVERRQR